MINITSWNELNAIRNNVDEFGNILGDYQLMNDLKSTDDDYEGIGDSWIPIGHCVDMDVPIQFTGTFNGNGHKICNLIILDENVPDDRIGVGLFGATGSACIISNLGLENISIIVSGSLNGEVGALIGENWGVIENCYSTGNFTGRTNNYTGGLVGYNYGFEGAYPIIRNCYSSVNIPDNSSNNIGGLVGTNRGTAIIENCYSIGNISGGGYVGGLAGSNGQTGSIINCYATGIVIGANTLGGFIGITIGGTITNCGWFRNLTGAQNAIGTTTVSLPCIPQELIDYNIKDGGGAGYIDDTVDWFYDKTRGIYTASPVWDFITPIWYERTNDFPKLDAGVVPPTEQKGMLPIFKRS